MATGISQANTQDLLHADMYGIEDPGTALANIFLDSGMSLANPTVRNSIQSLAPALVNSFLVRGAGGRIDPNSDSWDRLFRDYASGLMRNGNMLDEIRGAYSQFRQPGFGNTLRQAFNAAGSTPGIASASPPTQSTAAVGTTANPNQAKTPGQSLVGAQTLQSTAAPQGSLLAGRSSSGAMLGSDKWDEPDELDDAEEGRLRDAGYVMEGGRYVYRGGGSRGGGRVGTYADQPSGAPSVDPALANQPAPPPVQTASQPFMANPAQAAAPVAAQPLPAPKVVQGNQNPFVGMLMDLLGDAQGLGNFQYSLAAPWMGQRAAAGQRDLMGINSIEAMRRGYGGGGGDFFSALFGS